MGKHSFRLSAERKPVNRKRGETAKAEIPSRASFGAESPRKTGFARLALLRNGMGFCGNVRAILNAFSIIPAMTTQAETPFNDELNSAAYEDVLAEKGPSQPNNKEYMRYYRFWYLLGPEASREDHHMAHD